MKLVKYLDDNSLSIKRFAEHAELHRNVIRKVLDNGHINLDSAAKIIRASNGSITYIDLLPED